MSRGPGQAVGLKRYAQARLKSGTGGRFEPRARRGIEPRARAGGRALGSLLPLAVLAYGFAEAGPQGFGAIPGDYGGDEGSRPSFTLNVMCFVPR